MKRNQRALATAAIFFALAGCDDGSTRTVTLSVSPPEVEWLRQFGTTGGANDAAIAVFADASGNVFVAGATFGALPGQASAGNADAFVQKRDSSGAIVWTHQFGSVADDSAVAVFVDAQGAVYVGGSVQAALPGQTAAGGVDSYVRKIDASGAEVWTRQFGSSANDSALGVAVDATGIYACGSVIDTLPGQTSAGSTDAWVRKYDAAGTAVWTRQFGTTVSAQVDVAAAISVDATGVYVGGQTSQSLAGEPFAGGVDAFLRKYDTDGNVVWTEQFGSSANDQINAVSADGSAIHVGGLTTSTLTAQPTAGGTDAFVRKFEPDGDVAWTTQFGTSALDIVFGVSSDGNGSVYAVGRTDAALAGQTYVGGADAFARKIDAATGNEVWTRQIGSPFLDLANGVFASAAGVHVAGQARGDLPGQSGAGNNEAFVWTLDASGAGVRVRQFGTLGPVEDIARSVVADAAGNVYVAGDTSGSLEGASAGNQDGFVRKYDAFGNIVWTRQFGTAGQDTPLYMAAAGTPASIYVAGLTDAGFPGQTFAGPPTDVYVRKYDGDGNEVWTIQFGSPALDNPNAIAADASAVYIVGGTQGTLVTAVAGPSDAFVRKLDAASGNAVWTRQFGSTAIDAALAVAVDGSAVYVAGQTQGTLVTAVAGPQDAFVRKLDLDGNTLWTAQFGSTASDAALAILTGGSSVYVAGQTGGNLGGPPLGGAFDAFVRRLDPATGSALWTRQFGSSIGDFARSLALDATGVLVGGQTNGVFTGQTSAGLFDGFLQKYDPSGNVVFIRQFGSAQNDNVISIFADSSGNAYLAGSASGTLPGQTSAGADDAFVAKLVPARFP